jgi:hypothetical protein
MTVNRIVPAGEVAGIIVWFASAVEY